MEASSTKLLPKNLDLSEMKVLAYVLKNGKAAKIISILCDKKGSYFNEIQEKITGSKTSTQEILRSLERLKIVSSEWQVRHIDNGGKKVTRAVKMFTLTKDKETLLEEYLPLIKKMINS